MALRREFVALATQEGANRRALCRHFGISPTTGYRWLRRYQAHGPAGLQERSRRPHRSPQRTATAIEQQVLQLRDAHPAWGGRKIRRILHQQRVAPLPSASTITAILRRHDRLEPATSIPRPWHRFERPVPNDRWQMDFKGHFPLLAGGRCHPLTLLDDHSRFCLGLAACANERQPTVQTQLTQILARYRLPHTILTDNGPPWGAGLSGLSRGGAADAGAPPRDHPVLPRNCRRVGLDPARCLILEQQQPVHHVPGLYTLEGGGWGRYTA